MPSNCMLSRYMRQNGKFLIFMDAQIRGLGVHENYIWWTALSGVVEKIISNFEDSSSMI